MINKIATRFGMNPRELIRFLKFAVVGVIGAVVDFGTYNILLTWGMDSTIAQTISFVLAIISNFFWNRYWTYPDSRSKTFVNQFIQFFGVNFAGIFIRTPIVYFGEASMIKLVSVVGLFDADISIRIGKNLILMVAVGIVMFWNFFVNRYWTYNDVE